MSVVVFVSHGWHGRWIAAQMARLVREAGATPFVDIYGIKKGDRIAERVLDGLSACSELVALLTPWSVGRHWVWSELAAAWISRKRFVGVLYGLTLHEIDEQHGDWPVWPPTNVIDINVFDEDLAELSVCVQEDRE